MVTYSPTCSYTAHSRNKSVSGLLSERRRAAKDFVYDDEFKDTTLAIDYSDFKLQKQDDEDWMSEWYSKKEKCHAAK